MPRAGRQSPEEEYSHRGIDHGDACAVARAACRNGPSERQGSAEFQRRLVRVQNDTHAVDEKEVGGEISLHVTSAQYYLPREDASLKEELIGQDAANETATDSGR
jgi:hypothetical protein